MDKAEPEPLGLGWARDSNARAQVCTRRDIYAIGIGRVISEIAFHFPRKPVLATLRVRLPRASFDAITLTPLLHIQASTVVRPRYK